MKTLLILPIVLLLSLASCDKGNISNTEFIKAGFGVDPDSTNISTEDPELYEDLLMAQLPAKIVLKIENDRRLRYMELENIIKYKVQDTVIYDLTFLNDLGRKKTVKFNQNGNIIHR